MFDIVRWDPFRQLGALRREIDQAFARVDGGAAAPWSPRSDVFETDEAIVITAELPGVKDEDIDVSVQHGMLVIRGERRLEDEVKTDRYHHLERSYGGFRRAFRLPPGIEEKDIKAATSYGVLRITLPRPTAAPKHKVPIGAGA